MAKKSAPSGPAEKTKAPARPRKTVSKAVKSETRSTKALLPQPSHPAEEDVAQIKAFREQLGERGYASVFDVVRQGRAATISSYLGRKTAKRERAAAEQFYEQAEAHAAALARLHRQLTARGEPITQAVAKLGIAYDAEWLDRAIGSSGNYHEWFGQNLLYAHPDSVGSLFSPGSYLTTLYRVAKPLHPNGHALQLDKRRPDLKDLTLSDTHLNQELSTLALTLEIMEQGVTGDAEEKLRTTVFPMNLPYNHAWEQIRQGLAVLKSSQAEMWAVLADNEATAFSPIAFDAWNTQVLTPGCVRDRLGLSPEEYKILTEGQQTTEATVGKYYGLSRISDLTHVGSEASMPATAANLLDRTKLNEETLLQALGTGPYISHLSHPHPFVVFNTPPSSFELATLRFPNPAGGVHEVFTVVKNLTYAVNYNNSQVVVGFQMEVRVFNHSEGLQVRVSLSRSQTIPGNFTTVTWAVIPQTGITQVQLEVGHLNDFMVDSAVNLYVHLDVNKLDPISDAQSNPFAPRATVVGEKYLPVHPNEYGARYIYHGLTSVPPLYTYIGPQVGHPATPPANNPATSRLYNRHGQYFERLNRVIRLQRRVHLTFEELDWLIVAAAVNLADYPLTRPLQALAVYMPLRERYGFSVNAFVACIGSINTYHRPGEPSFFRELFGDADFLNTRLYLSPPRDDPPSQAARAILCRGLGISADVLITLARRLPGVIDDGATNGFVLPALERTHVDALYRLVAIPRLFGLMPEEALRLWDLLDTPGVIAQSLARQERPVAAALCALERTGYLVEWMQREGLDAAHLIAMTQRDYRQVATPELQSFIQNIYTSLGGPGGGDRDESALRNLLYRHIGAQFSLKPATSRRMIEWMDAVAARLNAAFTGYSVLKFWEQIQAAAIPSAMSLTVLEEVPQLVQYANLLGQFALVCHWGQLTEQDLKLVMPSTPGRSLLTGQPLAPLPDLPFLLLLSRYRQWQKMLVLPVAEGRRYLQRAATGEFILPAEAASELALLHGWDEIQVSGYLEFNDLIPKNFHALYPLIARIQLGQKLRQAPTDLAILDRLAEVTPTQNTLEQFAANILAAAHA